MKITGIYQGRTSEKMENVGFKQSCGYSENSRTYLLEMLKCLTIMIMDHNGDNTKFNDKKCHNQLSTKDSHLNKHKIESWPDIVNQICSK